MADADADIVITEVEEVEEVDHDQEEDEDELDHVNLEELAQLNNIPFPINTNTPTAENIKVTFAPNLAKKLNSSFY